MPKRFKGRLKLSNHERQLLIVTGEADNFRPLFDELMEQYKEYFPRIADTAFQRELIFSITITKDKMP